jgi:hypothetical protein
VPACFGIGADFSGIRNWHGCDSYHAASVAVNETLHGGIVWQGVVEVFELRNHPKAKEAYAWRYKNEAGEMRYVVVLGVPPVASAFDAVRAHMRRSSRRLIARRSR